MRDAGGVGGWVRIALGVLVLLASVLAATAHRNADFVTEVDVVYVPGGALINPEPDFERRATSIRCTSDGAQLAEVVFFTGQEPRPSLDDSLCDAGRRARGWQALAIVVLGAALGGWLLVGRPRRTEVEPPLLVTQR